ncbi:ABC transporter substrate-binding protein [Massiliimalia timonensis]|uniref:ABC transporter substrate-binding protein n=1 Tax=Massiliimalia timonensis TaxID=1987501 RepID=UPI000B8B8532|nr:extracellular solute-binding protein [Massiliimalia timonensis]
MRGKRIVSTGIITMLLAGLLGSCGPTSGAGTNESTGGKIAPEENKHLEIMTYDDDFWQRFVDDFCEKNPGYTVERKLSQAVDTGAIQATLSADDAPDILMVNSGPGRVLPLAQAGMLEDLTPYYEERGWADKTVPYVMDALHNFDNRIYEVVDNVDVFQMYYNKAIFEDAGVEPPTTWEEFENVLQTLKDAGVQPIVLGANDNFSLGHLMGNLIQSNVGYEKMTDILYGDSSWDCPEMIAAYQNLKDWVDKGYINDDAAAIAGIEGQTRHAMGEGAMMVIANGYLQQFVDQEMCKNEDFGTFMFPSQCGGTSAPTAGLAQSWVINKNADNKEGALVFLDYVINDKIDFYDVEKRGTCPTTIVPEGKLEGDPVALEAVKAMEGGAGFNPSVYTTANEKTAYYESNQAVLTGLKTPEEAVKAIQAAKEADDAK